MKVFLTKTPIRLCKSSAPLLECLGLVHSGQAFFKLCNEMAKLHPRSEDSIFALKSRNLDIIEWSKKSNNARKEREVKV